MTNFEKIKEEFAKMTAEEFVKKVYDEWGRQDEPWCRECLLDYTCKGCLAKWLDEEAEGE